MNATATTERPAPTGRPQFPPHSALRAELTRRVDAYFDRTGLDEKGGARMVAKTLILLGWAIASWALLVFWAPAWWAAVPLGISLGLACAGIGFGVMHDGGHCSYSRRGWVNKLMASTVDVLGGSSYFWNQKHNILHHSFTNVDGVDDDIDASPFLRMGPSQRRYWFHRFQHLYEVALLALFFVPKWAFVDDLSVWARGKILEQSIPRPRGWDAVQVVLGKVAYATWAFGIPLLYHSPLVVILGYAGVAAVAGITLGMVFQLAHAIEETEFHAIPAEGERLARSFFEHQLATTANFAPRNRLVSWYVGGLNFQVEHHLFPRISHLHYPAIAEIVRETCREHGAPYNSHDTVFSALRSHFRFLERMGRPAPVAS